MWRLSLVAVRPGTVCLGVFTVCRPATCVRISERVLRLSGLPCPHPHPEASSPGVLIPGNRYQKVGISRDFETLQPLQGKSHFKGLFFSGCLSYPQRKSRTQDRKHRVPRGMTLECSAIYAVVACPPYCPVGG